MALTAEDRPPAGFDSTWGFGLIDVNGILSVIDDIEEDDDDGDDD